MDVTIKTPKAIFYLLKGDYSHKSYIGLHPSTALGRGPKKVSGPSKVEHGCFKDKEVPFASILRFFRGSCQGLCLDLNGSFPKSGDPNIDPKIP